MTKDITIRDNTTISPFGSIEDFESCIRMAKALSTSTFIPNEFRDNIGDCLILLETASRTQMPIMALMQNMYIVHGKPSFSSAFMAGLINNSGRFDGPLQFVYDSDSCYAFATIGAREYKGITVTLDMAKKEGWLSKKGSKWLTMPEVMLQYRATSFFARAYCADIIMGMSAVDELIDTPQKVNEVHVDGHEIDLNSRFNSKEEAVDISTGEVKQEKGKSPARKNVKKQTSNKNVIDRFKVEIDAIKHTTHLDRWRMKHQKRIARELPEPGDQDSIFAYAQGHYLKLQAAEKEPMPPHPADVDMDVKRDNEDPQEGFVMCPAGNGNVSTLYCNSECKSRPGCPSFPANNGGSGKLSINL